MGQSKISHNNHTLIRPPRVSRCANGQNRGPQAGSPLGAVIAAGRAFRVPDVLFTSLFLVFILGAACATAFARLEINEYEGRLITSVEVVFEGSPPDAAAQASFLALLKVAPNTEYSAVRVRDSLQELFDTQRVTLISADEIRARVNLTQPGSKFSKQIIARNADEIQIYLRDRGYFNATVEPVETVDASGTRATVTYRIIPGEQAKVASFNVDIKGFDARPLRPALRLQPGAPFTREALAADIKRISDELIAQGFLAPQLQEPRIERDAERNQMAISLGGFIGPKTKVEIKGYPISEKTKHDLLPVMREGNIDVSAIEEGGRRLRNKLQEEGYFFAEVTSVCTVTPPTPELGPNGTAETCNNLNPEVLSGRSVEIAYQIEQGRRFRLTDIRIAGTNKISFQDIEADLKSQKASALGLIPFVGYGRGYTSLTLLEQDKRLVRNFMRDLGYRHAEVEVLQGVSVNGENLIITFNVTEGPLTRIAGVEVRGNKIYTDQRLRDELKTVIGAPFSRSQARFDTERVLALYAREGYVNARIVFSADELPKKGEEEQVRLVYSIVDEGEKVFINRIIVNGVTGSAKIQRTKRDAIARAIPLVEGDVLRADRIAESERELYLTDAYRQVIIRSEPAGETASGFKKHDVIIDVEEKKPRVMDYGGGFSTDTGALGLLEISNVNLMNKLRQGAMRLRASQRTQLLRFEYLDPRFARYGQRQFAPLSLSVEYQRDSTITRFFRSAIDRGTFGIVQRLDEKGNPIDDSLMRTNEPTINRFTVKLETQRVLDQKTKTIVFGRYAYEDVRLFNLQSLLIKPILQPDRVVRLSRFGGSFVRDTRERCERGFLGIVRSFDDTEPGAPGEVCRYNQIDVFLSTNSRRVTGVITS